MSKEKNKGDTVTAGHLSSEQTRLLIACLLALLLVVISALSVVYSSYKSRQLFSQYQQQNRQAMRLEEQWGRLLLEQSTWASHARIERLAKSELKMIVPVPETVIVVAR